MYILREESEIQKDENFHPFWVPPPSRKNDSFTLDILGKYLILEILKWKFLSKTIDGLVAMWWLSFSQNFPSLNYEPQSSSENRNFASVVKKYEIIL